MFIYLLRTLIYNSNQTKNVCPLKLASFKSFSANLYDDQQ